MEIGFRDLFTSNEMQLETHVHVQIENLPGFHEIQLHTRTRVENL